jgi:outer membrane murein-binding lipoprotein Lpp
VLFRFNKLDAKVSSDIAKLDAKISSDIAKLETKVSDLKEDVKSIKNNHLPHIEAAIKELSKGTLNEAHVKAILDLSHEPDAGKQ